MNNELSFKLVGLLANKLDWVEVISYLYHYCKLTHQEIAKFGFDEQDILQGIQTKMNWNIF